ncbi:MULTISPECIES: phosphoethanolamine transferase [unclassified Polaromonas]|uniref:phosphoethanolamine transferase n=1 Tax=unclassified Polaromonas TaxID=2638319 RepID=UPI000F07C48E|nr:MULTISPECIES: phosphoethanolamine--lipid A transferase [unclassified Polaromonas]AYQ29107.1 phosphoethanolamine--lipid A transferase [Polaromonas sp. SP1]QGJ19774.1 phosphoethanolamine--lipid A transferase [Polaromonas sp. Pch-P]
MPLRPSSSASSASRPVHLPTVRQNPGMRPLWLVVMASLWIATVCNVALWRELTRLPGLTGGQVVVISTALVLVIALATTALLSLLAWRWTLKPAVTLFLLSAAFGAYFMMAYGVVIDKTMMVNTLQTDVRETRDLMNWRLLATVLVLAVLPMIFVWRQKVRRAGAARQVLANAATSTGACVLLVLVVFLFFQSIASVMRNYTHVRYLINPLNSFYALGSIAAKPFQRDESIVLPLGEDAKLGARYTAQTKPPLLLLVLGETARSANFSLNGYGRPTNPLLAKEDVVSLRNAWSCGTSTAASVPCMFSNFGREAYDSRPANYEGMLDVLQRAGLAVLWIDNQSGCKGVCDRVPNVNTVALKVPGLCDSGECFDEVMLHGIDERIAALPAERRAKGVVVVMHQMGGHGPAYYKRSPQADKKFLPECTDNALQSCSREGLLNAYDNSIVYTDKLLASSIQWLKKQEARSAPALLYLADHGESLGENNLYLHGMPWGIAPEVQKRVPWITWLSPEFEQRNKLTTACLKQQLDTMVSHDNYFHSVLGLMNVQTSVYKPALDIYANCTKP